jgi:hypothetical protein
MVPYEIDVLKKELGKKYGFRFFGTFKFHR